MTDVEQLLLHLLDPTQQRQATTEFEKIKKADVNSTLLKLKDIFMSPKSSSDSKHLAAVEIKNIFTKHWGNDENTEFMIDSSSIKLFANEAYPMLKLCYNKHYSINILNVISQIAFYDVSGNFDFRKIFAEMQSDIKTNPNDNEINLVVGLFLKTVSKVTKDNAESILSEFSNEILGMILNRLESLNVTENFEAYYYYFKTFECLVFRSEIDFTDEKFLAQELNISAWIEILKSAMSSEVFIEGFKSTETEVFCSKLLRSCYRCSIKLAEISQLEGIDKTLLLKPNQMLDLIQYIENVTMKLFDAIKSSIKLTFNQNTDKLVFMMCAFISALVQHTSINADQSKDKLAAEIFNNSLIPILCTLFKSADDFAFDINECLYLKISGDDFSDIVKYQSKFETIKNFLMFALSDDCPTMKVIIDDVLAKVRGEKDNNLISAYLVVLGWIFTAFFELVECHKLGIEIIEMAKTNSQIIVPVLYALESLANLPFDDMNPIFIRICNYLTDSISDRLNIEETDEDAQKVKDCYMYLLGHFIDAIDDESDIIGWLQSRSVEILGSCLGIKLTNSNIKIDTDSVSQLSVPQARLIKSLSQFGFAEILENACQISLTLLADLKQKLLSLVAGSNFESHTVSPLRTPFRTVEQLIDMPHTEESLKRFAELEKFILEISEMVTSNKIEHLITECLDLLTSFTAKQILPDTVDFLKKLFILINDADGSDVYYDFRDVAPLLHNCFENFDAQAIDKSFLQNSLDLIATILAEEDELMIIEHEFAIWSKLFEVYLLNFGKILDEKVFKLCINLVCKLLNDSFPDYASLTGFLSEFDEQQNQGFDIFKRNIVLSLAAAIISKPQTTCTFAIKNITWLKSNANLWKVFQIAAAASKINHYLRVYSLSLIEILEVIGDEATQKDIIEEIKSLNKRIIKADSENCGDQLNVTSELNLNDSLEAENNTIEKCCEAECGGCEMNQDEDSMCDGLDEDQEPDLVVNENVLQNYTSKIESESMNFSQMLTEKLSKLNIKI